MSNPELRFRFFGRLRPEPVEGRNEFELFSGYTATPEKYSQVMSISYNDFEKVDIRVRRIVEVLDFPEARNPAFKLKIDFGSETGVKTSSVQAVGAHGKEELRGMLVCCVINFEPKRIANFVSEVLTLGFKNSEGEGWILVTPVKESVELGSRLK